LVDRIVVGARYGLRDWLALIEKFTAASSESPGGDSP